MFFTAALALAAASLAMAQDVTIDTATLTQCAQSTLSFGGSTGPYYVSVVPATDPCASDPYAEFYDVTGQSVDYVVNLPQGTQVQVYVADANGNEYWGPTLTVGDGDASCLPGAESASSEPATSSAPTTYIPPNANNAAATTPAAVTYSPSTGNTGDVADNSDDDVPVNAIDNTSGASTVTAGATLFVGAVAAVVALF